MDGNASGQAYLVSAGNRTNGRIPDPKYGFRAAGASGGSLTPGHIYDVAVTYGDGSSPAQETASNPTTWSRFVQLSLGPGENAIKVTFSKPPPGAVKQFIYVVDLGDSIGAGADPTDPTPYPPFANAASPILFDPRWERIDAATLVTPADLVPGTRVVEGGKAVLITQHRAGSFYPPGIGLVARQQGTAWDPTAGYGIFLDNCRDVRIRDVEILDSTRDGIGIGSADSVIDQPPIRVDGCLVEGVVIRRANRVGLSITGECNAVQFRNVDFLDNVTGFVIEPLAIAGADPHAIRAQPITNVSFIGCRFAGSTRPGVSGAPFAQGGVVIARETRAVRGLLLQSCLFDNNFYHLGIGSFSNESEVSVTSIVKGLSASFFHRWKLSNA